MSNRVGSSKKMNRYRQATLGTRSRDEQMPTGGSLEHMERDGVLIKECIFYVGGGKVCSSRIDYCCNVTVLTIVYG